MFTLLIFFIKHRNERLTHYQLYMKYVKLDMMANACRIIYSEGRKLVWQEDLSLSEFGKHSWILSLNKNPSKY